MKGCVNCGDTVQTLGEHPLCSMQCRRDWIQDEINTMDDDHARCPLCKESKHAVKTVVRHLNDVHLSRPIHRTKTCQECAEEFVPKNSENPNKYCSEACFGKAHQKYDEPYGTMDCLHCDEAFTYRKVMYDAFDTDPKYCSLECYRTDNRGNGYWFKGSPEQYEWTKAIHEKYDSCQECGSTEDLHAHHITPIKESGELATDVENGTLLCAECHADAHPDVPRGLILRSGGA